MTLRVPLDRLPKGGAARHARLREYFCDRDATAVREGDAWRLDLAFPDDGERHVDAAIPGALAEWPGTGLGSMALAHRRKGRVMTALYDTWTLVGWSEWVARTTHPQDAPLTLLHVDDHRDLMSPRLFVRDGALVDPIAGRPFDVGDPGSVRSSLESGAVGMGSFLTPFLHAFPAATVRHLGQAPKVVGCRDFAIDLKFVGDDLISPGEPRPAVRLADGGAGPAYRVTDDLDAWTAGLDDAPVLLHIDMDYFSNRYDGDGDWRDRPPPVLDPPRDAVMQRIDEVCAALRASCAYSRIGSAVVAYSPGFFPAEYWSEADRRLRAGLADLYG